MKERTGWLVQLPIIRWFEPTTPSAPANEASRHSNYWRSHPSLAKEGNAALQELAIEKVTMTVSHLETQAVIPNHCARHGSIR
jgi:hypothetical protein